MLSLQGGPYPNATGNSNAHNMGVDREYLAVSFFVVSRFYGKLVKIDTSSMLIMVLAHAQASGNRDLINAYVRPTLFSTDFIH